MAGSPRASIRPRTRPAPADAGGVRSAARRPRRRAPARGLRHLALRTTDLDAAERFYTRVLGLERAFAHRGMIFLRTPGGDDLLNFLRVRRAFDPKAGGLDHFGLRIPPGEWATLRARLRRARLPVRGRRGRAALYIRDPNGYTVELYRD